MPTPAPTSSQAPESQAKLCIILGVLICLVGLFFFGGSSTQSDYFIVSGGGYGYGDGYGYGGGGGAVVTSGGGSTPAPMFTLPKLLMLSFGATLITVGIISMPRKA